MRPGRRRAPTGSPVRLSKAVRKGRPTPGLNHSAPSLEMRRDPVTRTPLRPPEPSGGRSRCRSRGWPRGPPPLARCQRISPSFQVDGGDPRPGRLHQRQRLLGPGALGHVEGAPEAGQIPQVGLLGLALGEREQGGDAHRRHVEDVRLGIEAGPAPVGAAHRARRDQGALDRGRGEERTGAVLAEDRERLGAQLRGQVDEVVLVETLALEGRRAGGKRLRRRGLLARHVRRGHGPLFQRPDRLARPAVEDEGEAVLGHLRDRGKRGPVAFQVDQDGRRRHVVVPQVVAHELLVPDALARAAVEGHERAGEEVVALSVAAVEIARGRRGGQVHEPELRVDAHRTPHVGGPRVAPRLVLPGLGAELALGRHHCGRPSAARRCARRSRVRRPGRRAWRGGRRGPSCRPRGCRPRARPATSAPSRVRVSALAGFARLRAGRPGLRRRSHARAGRSVRRARSAARRGWEGRCARRDRPSTT